MNSGLVREFEELLGPSSVLYRPEDLLLYEYDGSVEKGRPDLVVFPHSTEDVSRIAEFAAKYNLPIVGRGAGTGLSGGALARTGGVMLVFARMNRILELDIENQRAVVQPGLVNYELTRAAEPHGLYFAPDPSRALALDPKDINARYNLANELEEKDDLPSAIREFR